MLHKSESTIGRACKKQKNIKKGIGKKMDIRQSYEKINISEQAKNQIKMIFLPGKNGQERKWQWCI